MKKAFTLVELMIVVAVLGILAAIVVPQLQGNTLQAKESVAKDTLTTLRTQIELYKMHHNGKYPGYMGAMPVAEASLYKQFEFTTNNNGQFSTSRSTTTTYPYGPYLMDFPRNPFNGYDSVTYVATTETFASKANDLTGWLYRRETGEIHLNKTGTDSSGTAYTDY